MATRIRQLRLRPLRALLQPGWWRLHHEQERPGSRHCSYIGANSGTYTQQDRIYYERQDVTTTYLRVHPGIATISQFLDYSPAASGMTYRNSQNPSGVTIDGVPDSVVGGPISWEQASGAQGSVTLIPRIETNLPGYAPGSYYLDDSTSPSVQQCGGYADDQAWGASGPLITSSGANTDPTLGAAYRLTGTRTNFYGGPGADAALAAQRSRQVDSPLSATASNAPGGKAKLKLSARAPKRAARRGRVRFEVEVANAGPAGAASVRICPSVKAKLARAGRCEKLGGLAAGDSATVSLTVKLQAAARAHHAVRVRFRAMGRGTKPDSTTARIDVARR